MLLHTDGLKEVEVEVSKVRRRELLYTIFVIPGTLDIKYKVITNMKRNNPPSIRKPLDETALKDEFNVFIKKIDPKSCCFIVYDFEFYTKSDGAFRSVLCLFSYIPDDSCAPNEKFVYSSNSISLRDALSIGKYIPVNNYSDITYEKVVECCTPLGKNKPNPVLVACSI
jgi:hypothetical protein